MNRIAKLIYIQIKVKVIKVKMYVVHGKCNYIQDIIDTSSTNNSLFTIYLTVGAHSALTLCASGQAGTVAKRSLSGHTHI